jgi:hypothetical protein
MLVGPHAGASVRALLRLDPDIPPEPCLDSGGQRHALCYELLLVLTLAAGLLLLLKLMCLLQHHVLPPEVMLLLVDLLLSQVSQVGQAVHHMSTRVAAVVRVGTELMTAIGLDALGASWVDPALAGPQSTALPRSISAEVGLVRFQAPVDGFKQRSVSLGGRCYPCMMLLSWSMLCVHAPADGASGPQCCDACV